MALFNYLVAQQKKQTKILNIQYKSLEMQEYLLGGNKNINVSKFIVKARSKTLDIKRNGSLKTNCVVDVKLERKLEKKFCLDGILRKKNILNPKLMICFIVNQSVI